MTPAVAAAQASVGRAPDRGAPDVRDLVSRADLFYDEPVTRSEEGMPVGNGRMGSLVWTSPRALKFQINRVDVFGIDGGSSDSFARAASDYSNGAGYVDVNFVDFAPELFSVEAGFAQHLSMYDGLMTARGGGITARVLAWHERDVFAIEVDDQRPEPSPVNVDLRMLRFMTQYVPRQNWELSSQNGAVVRTGAHTALSRLAIRDGGRIVLVQEFREGDHYASSAVAIAIVGRDSAAWHVNETTVRLSGAAGRGRYTILISSAASFDPAEDVAGVAIDAVESAEAKSFDGLLADNEQWWEDFWLRSYVDLRSDDGEAEYVAENYAYFLYLMAVTSRGDYMPRFGGMLWYTNGDMRAWGSQFWWANQSCYYNGLAPANRWELMEPLFRMYGAMYDRSATAARQQWGSAGIWIGETSPFNGFAPLPEDVAEEMRELYLLRKPWGERSERFKDYAASKSSHGSRWNWMAQGGRWEAGRWIRDEKGFSPFGHVTHIFGTTAKIAWLYWQRYEYTMDEAWLRERAYPMLRGAVEFYRNFPNLRKGEDGKIHLYHTNSNEPGWGVTDSDEDLSALRGVLPVLIRASEILNVDEKMRPVWQAFYDDLAPIPTSDLPDALKPEDYAGPRVWVKGRRPAVKPGGLLPDGNTLPMWNFELCTLETDDPETIALCHATLDAFLDGRLAPDMRVGVLSRVPIAAAAMGRADAVRFMLPSQLRSLGAAQDFVDPAGSGASAVFKNRLTLREGPGAIDAQRLGRVAEALHTALLQSAPPSPGKLPILRLFPAWPEEWDARFRLLARGAFLVTASMTNGEIEFVEIESQAGSPCRLRNPWPGETIVLERNGIESEHLAGEIVNFPTTRGETIRLAAVP